MWSLFAASTVRTHPRLSDGACAPVPMILLTGWKTAEVEQCAASFGCVAVLGKTVDPGILEQVVASVVEHQPLTPMN